MYILSPILLVIFKNLLKATKHFHKKIQNSGSRLLYFSKERRLPYSTHSKNRLQIIEKG